MSEAANESGPDPESQAELPADEGIGADVDPAGEQVGDLPSGQLVAPDEGSGQDAEKDLVAEDVGFDEGGRSAEEAAMHEIPEEPGG